jgi:hypothetical protein
LPFETLTVSGEEPASLHGPATLLVDDCMIYGMEVFADQGQGILIIEVAFQNANSPEGMIQICDEAADRFVNKIALKYGGAAELIPMFLTAFSTTWGRITHNPDGPPAQHAANGRSLSHAESENFHPWR